MRIHIKNLTAKHYVRSAVYCQNTKHVKVEGGTLRASGYNGPGGIGYGVQMERSGSVGNFGPNGDNNWITGVTGGGEIIPGVNGANGDVRGHRHAFIISWGMHHNLIENCTIVDCSDDAIDIHGLDERYNEVRYNTVMKVTKGPVNSGHGICLGNPNSTYSTSFTGPNNWVHHNTIRNVNGFSGIGVIYQSHRQYIEDNDIQNCLNRGIRIYNTGANDNGGHGLLVEDGTGLVVENHTSQNNGGYGINLNANTYYTINGFTSSGNTSGAIQRTVANGTYNP
jgi:hypothetical protein